MAIPPLTIAYDEDGGMRLDRPAASTAASRRWHPWDLRSIVIRDALVAVRVAHSGTLAERDRTPLASLVRAVLVVLGDHNLLRPLVVYVAEPGVTPAADADQLVAMKKWEDDQDWHRGRFVFFAQRPTGLLETRIAGLEQPASAPAEEPGGPTIVRETDVDSLDAIALLNGWTTDRLFLTVRDWASRWIEEHGRRPPTRDGRDQLRSALADWVAAEPVPEPDLPTVVLASYAPHEQVPSMSGVARDAVEHLYLDATADESTRQGWDALMFEPLVTVRRRLAQNREDTIALHARCTLAVAIRAGSVFHASSGLSAAVIQLNPARNVHELWQITRGRRPQLADVEVERTSPPKDVTELQLRISATVSVDQEAAKWTSAAGSQLHAEVLRISIPQSSDDSVRDADHAWDIARRVRAELRAVQSTLPAPVPVRIFYAGPVALAVWIGAQLNAVGEVILMDFLKDARPPRYVVSFSFQPGA